MLPASSVHSWSERKGYGWEKILAKPWTQIFMLVLILSGFVFIMRNTLDPIFHVTRIFVQLYGCLSA